MPESKEIEAAKQQIADFYGENELLNEHPDWDQSGTNQSWNAFGEFVKWLKGKIKGKK